MQALLSRTITYLQRAKSSRLSRNIGWNIFGSVGTALLSPIFSILTARILMPADYGIIAVALAVLAFMNVTKDLGMSQAIIVSHDQHDYLSIHFTFQLLWGIFLFAILVCSAPFIARFYDMPDLARVFPLLGSLLIINAFVDPFVTHHLKEQNYRLMFYRQIVPTVLAGASALFLAYSGFGIYALVAGSLINAIATAVLVSTQYHRWPRLLLDWQELGKLMKLGKHMMFQDFCGSLAIKADSLVVGKNLGATTLGYYQMGINIISLLSGVLTAQSSQVVFTDMSKNKGNHQYLIRRYYQFIYLVGSVSLVMSLAIFWSASWIVPLMLGEKWQSSVSVIQALSLIMPFVPLSILNTNLSKIYGYSHVYSYFAIIRAVFTFTLITIASFYSLHTVLAAYVLSGVLGATVNALVFFKNQSLVRPTWILHLLFGISIAWACSGLYLIMNGN